MTKQGLCKWWFCTMGPNTKWSGSRPGLERWERHCQRCGTLMVFSLEPFTFGPIGRWRERKRAAREAAEKGAAA